MATANDSAGIRTKAANAPIAPTLEYHALLQLARDAEARRGVVDGGNGLECALRYSEALRDLARAASHLAMFH